jgi:hypothetical protein
MPVIASFDILKLIPPGAEGWGDIAGAGTAGAAADKAAAAVHTVAVDKASSSWNTRGDWFSRV